MSEPSLCERRLMGERKQWRKDHPAGFIAGPITLPNGSTELKAWKCIIPGKKGTLWENGRYQCHLLFPEDYPSAPPKCVFKPVLFHPNVYPSGTVCLSILNPKKSEFGWRPSISVKEILLGVQHLLESPNWNDPACADPVMAYNRDPKEYETKVLEFIEHYMSTTK